MSECGAVEGAENGVKLDISMWQVRDSGIYETEDRFLLRQGARTRNFASGGRETGVARSGTWNVHPKDEISSLRSVVQLETRIRSTLRTMQLPAFMEPCPYYCGVENKPHPHRRIVYHIYNPCGRERGTCPSILQPTG